MAPYSNLHADTSAPSGLTVPFSVAVVSVIALAASVAAVGSGPVVNFWSLPYPSPPAFFATSR